MKDSIIANLRNIFMVLIVFIVNIICINECTAVNYSPNEKAIKEVMNGTRRNANATWWGFNEQDSTYALQTAIRSKANKIFIPNTGKPWIVEPLFLESGKEIIFQEGVVILAKKGSFQGRTDALLNAINKQNIVIRGYNAKLIMLKQDYMTLPYEKAEWRHSISLEGCTNVKIYGLRLATSGGDGIYLGRGIGKDALPNCDNIHIKNVIFDGHLRQGISVISASNLLIENCTLQNTNGAAPQAGIDFEPNRSDELLINCIVRNCLISNNMGPGVILYLKGLNKESNPISIVIEKCRISTNKQGSIYVSSFNLGNKGDTIQIRDSILNKRKIKFKTLLSNEKENVNLESFTI